MAAKPSSGVVTWWLWAAAGLLLAAACSDGNDSGRGTSPAGTPAPAATAAATPAPTSATHETAETTVTAVRDTGTSAATPTDATPTATPTPSTSSPASDTASTTTGGTRDTTGTTKSTVTPTTAPITDDTTDTTGPDDTTTPTTEADNGDGTEHEPRNDVDRKYPIGSDERQTYLAASGGVAPVSATVTLDLGATGVFWQQHGRTTADRWSNGFPAAPGSPNYAATTFAQREAQRAARWMAAMERGGVDRYWVRKVPRDPDELYLLYGYVDPEPAELTALRAYAEEGWDTATETIWGPLKPERPPAHLIWAVPRLHICDSLAGAKRTDHRPSGVNTLPCEAVLDWALWMVEQFASPPVSSLPLFDQAWTVAYRMAAVLVEAQPQLPTSGEAAFQVLGNVETARLHTVVRYVLYDHLATWHDAQLNDVQAYLDADDEGRDAVIQHFLDEVDAGRQPWELVP